MVREHQGTARKTTLLKGTVNPFSRSPPVLGELKMHNLSVHTRRAAAA